MTLKFNRERMRREFQLEYAAEAAIRELLSQENWEKRSFKVIRRRLGGFDDSDLRKHLVRAGAVRFAKAGEIDGDNELWGLRERNQSELSHNDE